MSVPELVQKCSGLNPPPGYLEVDDPDLLLPGDMPEKIWAQLERRQIGRLSSGAAAVLETTNLILHSLARRYAEVLQDIAAVTG